MRSPDLFSRFKEISWIALLASFGAATAFAVTEEIVDVKFDVTPGAKLIVDVGFGNIEVVPGADNQIAVSAYRKLEADSKARETAYAEAAPIQITKEGNTVKVHAQRDEGRECPDWGGGSKTMQGRYLIQAPKTLEAQLRTGGGSIVLSDAAGKFKATTGGGNLKFSRLRGPLDASSAGGDIQMVACDGAIDLQTSGGRISAEGGSGVLLASTAGGSIVVKEFNGDAKVETSGGKITLENIRGKVVGETSGGSIAAKLAAPLLTDTRLETAAGRIEVAVPSDAALDLEAETSEGSVTSELPVVAVRAGREGLKGTINGGGKALVLRTGAGVIAIKSALPAPPSG